MSFEKEGGYLLFSSLSVLISSIVENQDKYIKRLGLSFLKMLSKLIFFMRFYKCVKQIVQMLNKSGRS